MRRLPPALVALALAPAALGAVDPFYSSLLQQARENARRRPAEAVEQLRIASFGLLDDPVLLTEALVRLAIAQRAAGREKDAAATVARFADVEQRFHAYTKASLEPDVRSEFEALLGRRLPAEPPAAPQAAAAAPPPRAPARAEARPTPAPRETERQASGASEPRALEIARESAARGDLKGAIRFAGRALDAEPNSDEALAIRAHALTQRESYRAALADLRRLPSSRFSAQPELWADLFVCLVGTSERAEARSVAANVPPSAAARADVAKARKTLGVPLESANLALPSTPAPAPRPRPEDAIAEARDLRAQGKRAESRDVLASAVAKDPRNRELRKELLEAAYLAKDWTTGAAQIASLEPFRDGEEPWMFYAAVAAWETGRQDAARTLLRRARPRISDDAFVDLYTKKILGR